VALKRWVTSFFSSTAALAAGAGESAARRISEAAAAIDLST
jgi:hypothetical protein